MSITLISRVLFYITLLVVTYLALAPQEQVHVTTGWDKLNHLLAFFVLLALLDYAYPLQKLWRNKIPLLIAYAVLIELVQPVLSDRDASLLDVVADVIGLGLFLLVRTTLKDFLQNKLKLI